MQLEPSECAGGWAERAPGWLACLALVLLACGGSGEQGEPETAPRSTAKLGAPVPGEAQLCAAFCDRARDCGQASCGDCPAKGRRLEHLRPEYLWRLLMCVDGVSCHALTSATAWSACHDYALGALQPSRLLRRFCFDSARRAARCGRAADADQSACLVDFRHVGDEALALAIDCLAERCEQVPGCLSQKLGVPRR